MGNALLIDPSKLDRISAIKTMLTAVIGAVGPDIWVGVPPKKAAKKLIKIAPYKPALDLTQNLTQKLVQVGEQLYQQLFLQKNHL